jgi:hypothetical protein
VRQLNLRDEVPTGRQLPARWQLCIASLRFATDGVTVLKEFSRNLQVSSLGITIAFGEQVRKAEPNKRRIENVL